MLIEANKWPFLHKWSPTFASLKDWGPILLVREMYIIERWLVDVSSLVWEMAVERKKRMTREWGKVSGENKIRGNIDKGRDGSIKNLRITKTIGVFVKWVQYIYKRWKNINWFVNWSILDFTWWHVYVKLKIINYFTL